MKTLIMLLALTLATAQPISAMRDYDDPQRTRQMSDAYELGARQAERNNPAIQIVHGIDRMQANIKNARAIREETERRKKLADIEMEKAELELQRLKLASPEDAAALKAERESVSQ